MSRALKAVSAWCRENMHQSIAEQAMGLGRKLRGHYQYFGITGNSVALGRFHHWVRRIWRRWLERRSRKARMTWVRFEGLLSRHPLPMPVAVHSIYRQQRTRASRSRMRQ